MPSLVSLADARALIQTDVADSGLQLLLDAAEQQIVNRWGPNYPGPVTITKERTDYSLETLDWLYYTERPIETVTTITEVFGDEYSETSQVLSPNDYRIFYGGRALQRLGNGTNQRWLWGHRVTLVYVPLDDTLRRKEIIIELVRLALRHSGVRAQSEGNIAETSYEDYSKERSDLVGSLGPALGFA